MLKNDLHFLSKEEADLLLSETKKVKEKLIILLMLDCGLRVSETCSLQLKNIDFKKREISVFSLKKREKQKRIIPLSNRLYQTLSEYIEFHKIKLDANSFLFPSKGGKLPFMDRTSVWKILNKKRHSFGIEQLHPHSLRHTFATHHLASGTQLEDIKTMLGHESYDTTLIYTKIPTERLRERIDAVTSPPPSLFDRFISFLSPKSKPKILNISFQNNSFTIGRNTEFAKIESNVQKNINTLILGPIGVGKSHLLEHFKTDKKILRLDDTESIKKSLIEILLYLYKDKEAVKEAVWKDFSLDEIKKKVQRENTIQICETIKATVQPKEYILLIDNITGITPQGKKSLEYLKDTFILLCSAREIKANDTSFLWNFEELRLENLNRNYAFQLISNNISSLETENRNFMINHIFEQTDGNPRAIFEMIDRYRKEPILTNTIVRKISHTGALAEIDLTFLVVIFLGIVTALRYAASELDEPALRLVGSVGLILLLISRPFFASLKKKFI